jgi:hypothetical protein
MSFPLVLLRFVVTPMALAFTGVGIRFWLAPEAAARDFGLEAADAAGLVALRADLGGLFLGLALLVWAGAWVERRRPFLLAAAVVLLAIAAGRLVGGALSGTATIGAAELAVELGAASTLFLAARASARSLAVAVAEPERRLVTKRIVLTLAAFALAVPATASSVRRDVDPTVDLKTWKSWAWKELPAKAPATIAESRIRRELERALAAKGYERVEAPSEADFLVGLHAAVGRDLRIDEVGPRFRRDARVTAIPTGTLVVDLVERATGKLAWRGAVSDALARDPEKAERNTEKAMAKLLEKVPPAAVD